LGGRRGVGQGRVGGGEGGEGGEGWKDGMGRMGGEE